MASTTEIGLRMATAVMLGGLIGYERGRRDHPAGLRTHMLVTLAAASMLISTEPFHDAHYDRPERISFDPSRVASYVVAGIGFLGAGSILRAGSDIKGLTAAASLWMTTAIGLASGAGMHATAAIATALALAILTLGKLVEHQTRRPPSRRIWVTMDGAGADSAASTLIALIAEAGHPASAPRVDRTLGGRGGAVVTLVVELDDAELAAILTRLEGVAGVRRIRVDSPSPPPGGGP